jgi:eukaryotic-like serine/threonine-protein kinase
LAALNNQPAAAKSQPSYVPPAINVFAYSKDQREKFSFETVYLTKGIRQVTETKKVLKPNWWGVGSKEVEESHTKKVNDWQIITKSGQADRLIEDLGNEVQLEMVKIPGGEFLMGAPNSEHTSRENERPQHLVKVPRFYLGRYPITQEQYVAIMGNNPSQCTGDRLPVENVDWNDAQLFCQRLTAYTQKSYRLPTEAEWEYACRARTTTPFCFGETISTKLANYNGKLTYGSGIQGKYQSKSTPVGDFPPNGFGLGDMHGNVWEWCADSWHNNYSGAPIDGSAWTGSASRVLRGGSWFVNPSACRSAYRGRANAGDSDAYIGFRVAYVP